MKQVSTSTNINYFGLITGDKDDSGNSLTFYNKEESNYECIVLPSTTNSTTITRSTSLGIQYNPKKQTKSIFPLSGYEDEEDLVIEPLLIRSYSLDTKEEFVHHREYMAGSMCKLSNATYPDLTHVNGNPPLLDHEIRITNQYGHIHALTVKGSIIVLGTAHHNIRSYNIQESTNTLFTPIVMTADQLESISLYNDSIPSTSTKSSSSLDNVRSVCFSPAMNPNDDNKIVWAGTETGSILAIDIQTDEILVQRMATHSHPVTFILRYKNTELWTLDQGGNLNIWPILKKETPSSSSTINLLSSIPQRFQVLTQNARAALLSQTKSNMLLWLSNGRSIERFDRSLAVCDQQDWIKVPADLGDIAKLFEVPCHANVLFAMHADGHISAWNEQTRKAWRVYLSIIDKLTSVTAVGDYHVWAGYEHGTMAVYDTRQEPWVGIKLWKAHSSAVVQITVDEFSILDSTAVVSMDSAGHIAIWDGLLSKDWIGI
jgi:hypothetical protein